MLEGRHVSQLLCFVFASHYTQNCFLLRFVLEPPSNIPWAQSHYRPDYGVGFPVLQGAIRAGNTLNVNGHIGIDPTSSVFTNSTVESFIPCYDATTDSSPGGAKAALNAGPVQNISATVNIASAWMLALHGTTLYR
jgi:hypothetical protein